MASSKRIRLWLIAIGATSLVCALLAAGNCEDWLLRRAVDRLAAGEHLDVELESRIVRRYDRIGAHVRSKFAETDPRGKSLLLSLLNHGRRIDPTKVTLKEYMMVRKVQDPDLLIEALNGVMIDSEIHDKSEASIRKEIVRSMPASVVKSYVLSDSSDLALREHAAQVYVQVHGADEQFLNDLYHHDSLRLRLIGAPLLARLVFSTEPNDAVRFLEAERDERLRAEIVRTVVFTWEMDSQRFLAKWGAFIVAVSSDPATLVQLEYLRWMPSGVFPSILTDSLIGRFEHLSNPVQEKLLEVLKRSGAPIPEKVIAQGRKSDWSMIRKLAYELDGGIDQN